MAEKTWIQIWWPQILAFISLGALGIKNQVDTYRTKKAVFDDNGDLRVVTVSQCDKKTAGCNAKHQEEKVELRREMQNIHSVIDKQNKALADMPLKIAEHLKKMGHF